MNDEIQASNKHIGIKRADWQEKYKEIAGFCKSASIQEIKKNDYILIPGRYIDFKEAEKDGSAFDEKMKHLTAALEEQMNRAKDLGETIKNNLLKICYDF